MGMITFAGKRIGNHPRKATGTRRLTRQKAAHERLLARPKPVNMAEYKTYREELEGLEKALFGYVPSALDLETLERKIRGNEKPSKKG